MAVIIGSARSNERGTTTGGRAGDQTGREVSTQTWYLHSKGWVVIRANDATAREKIAKAMEMACANDNIGYCQTHRTTATNTAKQYGYDFSKIKTPVETDCSDLVRGCCLYAGITVGTFNTSSERSALEATGKFTVYTSSKYCNSSQYLVRGDILVTKTKGHTVVVLSNGSQVSSGSSSSGISAKVSMPQIKKGSEGLAVKVWQAIIGVTADGIFGSNTQSKTKTFQSNYGLSADGVVGKNTWAKGIDIISATIAKGSRGDSVTTWQVIIGEDADGIFGNGTYNTTRNFQKANGLDADGVVGKNTWTAGFKSVANDGTTTESSNSSSSSSSSSSTKSYPTLKNGSKGTAVKVWQAIIGEDIDGIFGSGTESKTKTFQKNHGLSADGIVGDKSWAAGEEWASSSIIKTGSKGDRVKVWQAIIGVTADGIFGNATDAKTKELQKANGLTADGDVGPNTWPVGFATLKS